MTHLLSLGLIAALVATIIGIAIRRWPVPYFALFFYLGISNYLASRHEAADSLRDLFFVAPAYIGFLQTARKRLKFVGIPPAFALTLLLFCLIVLCEAANPHPESASVLVRFASIRSWILLAPFLYLTYALLNEPRHIVEIFRIFAVSTWLPLIFGLLQGVRPGGGSVTATLAGPEEYRGYAVLSVIVGYTLFSIDTDTRWRSAAMLTAVAAASGLLLSGDHQVLCTLTVIVLMLFGFHRGSSWQAAGLVALLGTAALFLSLQAQHAQTGSGSAYEASGPLSFVEVLERDPFGSGTGSSLRSSVPPAAAAPVRSGPDIVAGGPQTYFSQAAWELGLPGVILCLLLFIIPYESALAGYRTFTAPELRGGLGGCMTYLSLSIAGCATHHFLQSEVNQLFFWMFLGILFRLNALRATYRSLIRSSFSPYLKPSITSSTGQDQAPHVESATQPV